MPSKAQPGTTCSWKAQQIDLDLKGDIDMDNDDAEMDQPKAVKL